jgi:hypothetical protein
MDRYQRVEKPRPEAAAISENEIRITTQGLIRNYVTYATSLLQVPGLPSSRILRPVQPANPPVALPRLCLGAAFPSRSHYRVLRTAICAECSRFDLAAVLNIREVKALDQD